MPYIEKRYRPSLDWYIRDAIDNKLTEALDGICKTLEDKDTIPVEIFDGALNYTCTQLYCKCNISVAEPLTILILSNFYLSNPRYTALKDALGLLDGMTILFDSKEIFSKVNSISDVVSSLARVHNQVKNVYIIHEHDAKIKNGDLE